MCSFEGMIYMKTAMMIGAALAMLVGGVVQAEEHEVRMLNRGEEGVMVFEPAFLSIAAGDSVRIVPTDRGHNAESMRGLHPEGAEPFKSRMNEEVTVTFDVAGAYGIQCLPHLSMGMVMLVVVDGDTHNIGDIEEARMPPKARERMDGYIAQARQ